MLAVVVAFIYLSIRSYWGLILKKEINPKSIAFTLYFLVEHNYCK